jgi:LmbE family N-acetylglucosaminyl deacetylase
MLKKLAAVLILSVLYCAQERTLVLAQDAVPKLESFNKNDRVLILAPHPDDETVGCAGIIQQAKKSGANVRVAYLTNGDNNEFAFIVYEKRLTFKPGEFIHMGEVRRKEAIKAMKLLGLNEDDLVFLGYPDFGTFTIFNQYWQAQKPFRSMFSRATKVPYKNDLSFGAPYVGESVLSDLEKVIIDYKPTKIFVSHPADVNVDHKALYLFLQVALRDLRKEFPGPKVYPYLVHCLGWPKPRHYHPELGLEPPANLAAQVKWLKADLTPEELELKHQAVLCYKSQTESSAFYLLSFGRKNELFGDYPEIELSRQVSLKERAAAFFGFSKMFPSSEDEGTLSSGSLIPDQGEVSYAVVDNCFLIRVKKDKELVHRFSLMFYIFGFSDKTKFSSMPKIRVNIKNGKFKVYDCKEIINSDGVRVDLGDEDLVLRIPLTILGDPDFILTSVKVYGGKLPLSATGFRKIVIKEGGTNAGI